MDKRWKKIVLVGSITLAIIISLVLTTGVIASKWYENRILPNTTVAGVSMSGKSLNEVKSLISAQAIAVTTQPITLALGETTATTSALELGMVIDEQETLNQLSQPIDSWIWAKPSYWKHFFTRKEQILAYSLNEPKLTETLNNKFPVSKDPVDAGITINNGQLETTLAQNGITIDMAEFKKNISDFVRNTTATTFALKYSETMPLVSNEEANRVKTEIASTLQPIYLASESQSFMISVTDLTKLLGYDKQDARIAWHIDLGAMQGYLRTKVASKLNVKMVQKTILSTTGEVTQEGKDGKEVDTALLARTINQTVANRTVTSLQNPIPIPTRTIAFTEKTVHPGFQPGLYPGKYISINRAQQKLYLIEGNVKIAEYSVSTGKWSTPTPSGIFYIVNKSGMAYSRAFGLWMPNWNGLAKSPDGTGNQGYGIHSLPCFNRSCTAVEGQNHIGTPVSHGCIRLPSGGDTFVYAWAPLGTPVVIE